MVSVILKRHQLPANHGCDTRLTDRLLAKIGFQLRLVKHIARLPAIRTKVHRCLAEQPLAPGITKSGTLTLAERLQQGIHFLGQSQGLKMPHHLPIKIHRPRHGIDFGVLFYGNHLKTGMAKQQGRHSAYRSHTDNRHIKSVSSHRGIPNT